MNLRITRRAHASSRDADALAVRQRLGLSQAAFARMLGVSVWTLRDWEQGRRKPDATSLAYLTVIERDPEAVVRALQSA